jgi:NHL repeat-containing protein
MEMIWVRRLLVVAAIATVLVSTASAGAFEPTKWVLSSHWGSKVDKTTGKNVCTVKSKDECQPGQVGPEAGGFRYAKSVAVAPSGDVYVADEGNHRIQEFTSTGEFIAMFGFEVNKKSGDTCLKTEEPECQEGGRGNGEVTKSLALSLVEPEDVAVDPTTKNVYVYDATYNRVDELSENGEFILMVGKEVNKTKDGTSATEAEKNLCTETEIKSSGTECKTGILSGPGSKEHGAFRLQGNLGNLLAVGPEDHLLYVGDEGRVQEFDSSGKWTGEISTGAARTTALAVAKGGEVFVAGQGVAGVHEYKSGVLQSCVIDPGSMEIEGLGIDAFQRLGVIDHEPTVHIVLYQTSEPACGVVVASSEVSVPGVPTGVTFDSSNDRMYVAVWPQLSGPQEVEAFEPIAAPEAKNCKAKEVTATSVLFCGKVNPNSLKSTGFFRWGKEKEHSEKDLTNTTPVVFEGEGNGFVPVQWRQTELEPKTRYWYETIAAAKLNNETVLVPSGEEGFQTDTPPPDIRGPPFNGYQGPPVASFVTSQSAVLAGSVNAENTVTHYHFEYAVCKPGQTLAKAGCPNAQSVSQSEAEPVYGLIGVSQEARGLSSNTSYVFRIVADNEVEEQKGNPQGGASDGEEGHLTTRPAPMPQAVTGFYSEVGTTSAVVSGQVDPDGEPAIYRFELGIYNGAATQYGIALSAPAGEGTTPTTEKLQLSGLQPDTTYAYRIAIESSFVENESHVLMGAPMLFTTAGVPEVIAVPAPLPMLPIPKITSPKTQSKGTSEPRVKKCRRGYKRNKHGKCVRAKGRKAGKTGRASRRRKS